MSVTYRQDSSLIFELAYYIARAGDPQALILAHQPDGVRCRGCTSPTVGARQLWPCTTYAAAERALEIEVRLHGDNDPRTRPTGRT